MLLVRVQTLKILFNITPGGGGGGQFKEGQKTVKRSSLSNIFDDCRKSSFFHFSTAAIRFSDHMEQENA